METAKAEQKRFTNYLDLYYENSEETSVAGADLISAEQQEKQMKVDQQTQRQQTQMQMRNSVPVVSKTTTPTAKAKKTIQTRRTTLGKKTVSKSALKKLKGE